MRRHAWLVMSVPAMLTSGFKSSVKEAERLLGLGVTLSWVPTSCLSGWRREEVWVLRFEEGGHWTSPGQYYIRECLSCGEEGKDDPVHHPLDLRGKRAASRGAQGLRAIVVTQGPQCVIVKYQGLSRRNPGPPYCCLLPTEVLGESYPGLDRLSTVPCPGGNWEHPGTLDSMAQSHALTTYPYETDVTKTCPYPPCLCSRGSCSTHIFLHVFGLHGLVGGIGWVQGAEDEPREAGVVTGPFSLPAPY